MHLFAMTLMLFYALGVTIAYCTKSSMHGWSNIPGSNLRSHILKRQSGYTPETGDCGTGNTCAEARGSGFQKV